MSVTSIIVKFDIEGGHRWPDAPEGFEHLREHHHHIFHFECYIPVKQSNRELEFLEVRNTLIEIVEDGFGRPCDFEDMSCEVLAQLLFTIVEKKYEVRPVKVVVMEDAFVGAELSDVEGLVDLKAYLKGGLTK